jgi:glucokinase
MEMADRYIGVDVGGTKISCAVLQDGELSPARLTPTDTTSSKALVAQIAQVVQHALDTGEGSAVVGIGVPGVVDFVNGRIRWAPNIPADDVPLRDELQERAGVDVFVDNDATVAALAEACDDAGEVIHPSLAMLTLGTGIGGGVVHEGRIFRGATGAATELGHLLIGLDLTDGAPDVTAHFPQPGSLEREAAGRVLDRLGEARGYADGPAVVDAARRGEPAAQDAIRLLGERLGIGISCVLHAYEPAIVCIGGGVSAAGELLMEPARRVARAWTLPGVGERCEIRLARWGPGAGVRGAALLAKQETDAPRLASSPTHEGT